jgi:hypothetical protein
MTVKTPKKVLKDPFSLVPVKLPPKRFKELAVTVSDIRKAIFSEQSMATTYVYGRFEKIVVSREVPTAATMANKRTGRISMFLNPDFVKRCIVSKSCSRQYRKFRGVKPRSVEFGCNNDFIEKEMLLDRVKQEAVKEIMKHEFGHVFFGHIEGDPDEEHFFLNLVQDALLNYHLSVDLGLVDFERMGTEHLLINSLTDIRWAEPLITIDRGYYRDCPDYPIKDVKDWKCTPVMGYEKYAIWRAYNTLKEHTGKGIGDKALCEFIENYVEGVVNYSKNYKELIEMARSTFPALKRMSDQNRMHQHGPASIMIDGEEYRPASRGDLPPIVSDMMGEIFKQAGLGGDLVDRILEDIKDIKLKRATIKSLMEHASKSLLGTTKRELKLEVIRDKRARTILPNNKPVVKDLFLESALALDRPPKYIPLRARKNYSNKGKRVFMFIDVSGSMMDVWDKLIAFCRALSKICELKLFQFSTEVEEMTSQDLKNGNLKTTGGTCLTPVVEKIRELSNITDAFIVIGDRYYSGLNEVTDPANPLRLLDVCYNDGGSNDRAWFKTTGMCEVHGISLSEDFEVL